MNKPIQKKEDISAWLDGELAPDKSAGLQDELLRDPSLRAEKEALAAASNAVAGLPHIKENPWFETRLMERLNAPRAPWYRAALARKPVIGFALLTLLSLAVFKFYPALFGDVYRSQQANLRDFYVTNLRPIIFSGELTNEDLFNFAFNKTLPLNKENAQVLSFGTDNAGKEYVEVKYAGLGGSTVNLNTFVNRLALSESEKQGLDSILASYSDKISSTVLVNDNNTVAVNSRLWGYNNNLRADIIRYAASVKKEVFEKVLPASLRSGLDGNAHFVFTDESNVDDATSTYVCIAPDTAFTTEIAVNLQDVHKQLALAGKQLAQHKKDVALRLKKFKFEIKKNTGSMAFSSGTGRDVHVVVDSNSVKVSVPEIDLTGVDFPGFGEFSETLDSVFSSLASMGISSNEDENGNGAFSVSFREGASASAVNRKSKIRVRVDTPPAAATAAGDVQFFLRKNGKGIPLPQGSNLDSLIEAAGAAFEDSLEGAGEDGLNNEMKSFRNEMKKFREEMERLRNELQNSNKDKEKKKPIKMQSN